MPVLASEDSHLQPEPVPGAVGRGRGDLVRCQQRHRGGDGHWGSDVCAKDARGSQRCCRVENRPVEVREVF